MKRICPPGEISGGSQAGQKLLIFIVTLSILVYAPAAAAVASKAVDTASGDTIFWIIISVVMSYIFLKKAVVSAILGNPLVMVVLIALLILMYITYQVSEAVFGFSNMLDAATQNIVTTLTGGN